MQMKAELLWELLGTSHDWIVRRLSLWFLNKRKLNKLFFRQKDSRKKCDSFFFFLSTEILLDPEQKKGKSSSSTPSVSRGAGQESTKKVQLLWRVFFSWSSLAVTFIYALSETSYKAEGTMLKFSSRRAGGRKGAQKKYSSKKTLLPQNLCKKHSVLGFAHTFSKPQVFSYKSFSTKSFSI